MSVCLLQSVYVLPWYPFILQFMEHELIAIAMATSYSSLSIETWGYWPVQLCWCVVHDVCVCVVVFAGEFGTVYKGTWKDGSKQTPIAVKTLRVG